MIFYCTILAVLLYARKIRDIFCWPHLAAIVLILVICLGWAYLAYKHSEQSDQRILSVWVREWMLRADPAANEGNPLLYWLNSRAKTLGKLLPWVAFVPLLWTKKFVAAIPGRQMPVFKGCRLAFIITFILINLPAHSLPRYSLPLFPLPLLLVGWLLARPTARKTVTGLWRAGIFICAAIACFGAAAALLWIDRSIGTCAAAAATAAVLVVLIVQHTRLTEPLKLTAATAAFMAAFTVQYAAGTLTLVLKATRSAVQTATFLPNEPLIRPRQRVRPLAAGLTAALPPNSTLYVYQVGNPAVLFYMKCPIEYLSDPAQIGPQVRCLLIRQVALEQPEIQHLLEQRPSSLLHQFDFELDGRYKLLELSRQPAAAAAQ